MGLKLKNIFKSYGKEKILQGLDLEVNDSEFLVLVGPSGCGKSTIIRCIAGLEEIDSGEITFDEKRLDTLAPKDRDLSMVFQNYALYPHKTVFENIAFPLRINKKTEDEIQTAVKEVACKLDLENYLDRKPKELSGGQRQRVALARAMIKKPKIYLMDEPLSNLDAKLRSQMRAEIKKLHRETQAIFIYVTHDQIEALSLGDRIVVLKQGAIEQCDAPKKVYAEPASAFVASFIGSPPANLIKLNETNFSDFKNLNAELGKTLAIRPEQISLEKQEGYIEIDCHFIQEELLGDELLIHCSLGKEAETKLIVKSKDLQPIIRKYGQPLSLYFKRENALLF